MPLSPSMNRFFVHMQTYFSFHSTNFNSVVQYDVVVWIYESMRSVWCRFEIVLYELLDFVCNKTQKPNRTMCQYYKKRKKCWRWQNDAPWLFIMIEMCSFCTIKSFARLIKMFSPLEFSFIFLKSIWFIFLSVFFILTLLTLIIPLTLLTPLAPLTPLTLLVILKCAQNIDAIYLQLEFTFIRRRQTE